MKISGLQIMNLEEIFKLDFKEWKIQNRQERPRTRDYSVMRILCLAKFTNGLKKELKKFPARPEVKKA